ncbi:L-rhamnose mutarotase [Luteimicrobium sp. DT211]|uniref:L-rhamnose mutarotase n=1 Tax=Luteimicrobium sp. DT211 TaxID=3393412 RepID=UPI003CF85BBB
MAESVRRVAQLIRLRPGKEAEYRALHRAVPEPVLAALRAAGIRNYSIFERDGLLLAYFEHTGDDLAADLARVAADPATQEWWRRTDPCQEPVDGAGPGAWWADAVEVFHLD